MSNGTVRLLLWWFRAVARCYPVGFRRRFLADMVQSFESECLTQAARGRWALVTYGGLTLLSTLWAAFRLRLDANARPRLTNDGPRWSAGSVLRDIRYAFRTLGRAPGFTVTALLVMALGIGVTTAVFTLVDRVLLEPLPYPHSDRLVRLFEQNSPTNRWSMSVVDLQAVVSEQRSFESVAALRQGETTVTGVGEPRPLRTGWVTLDWFTTLGVQLQVGRGFLPGEDDPAAPQVVVVSRSIAEQYFGTATAALGRSMTLDGSSFEVIGVLPGDVQSLAGWRADVWPILKLATPTRRGPFFLQPIARLRPEVTVDAATADLAGISERLFPLWADSFQDTTAKLIPVPLKEVVLRDVDTALYLLLGAVGLVLLIAVANVANLQLARAFSRDQEMAIRTALGARRGRLASQLLVESLLLSAAGGLLGIALARVALRVLVTLGPSLPRLDEVGLDLRALGFTVAITLASGLLFGSAPLAHALSSDPARTLSRGSRGGLGGTTGRARAALVIAEFALAVPLLAGAMLLVTSLARLQRVDPGFDPAGLVTARVALPTSRYGDGGARVDFWERVLSDLGEVPGVAHVAISSGLPPDAPQAFNNFDLVDRPVPEGTAQPVSPWLAVSPGFFQTLGVPLLSGRVFQAGDTLGTSVVVSQDWADHFYPGENPVGRRLLSGGCTTCTPLTVVGVVGNVAFDGLDAGASEAVYMPYPDWAWSTVQVIIRGNGGTVPMDALRQVIGGHDPSLALADVGTMADRLRASVSQPRYWSLLLGAFAVLGTVLAAVGIYAVLSNSVLQQRRDIGIRLALGASRPSVVRMIVARGMRQAVAGLAIGLAGALVLTRGLEGLLFGVSATDPIIYATVSLGLLVVALAACYGPARQATRVDPVRALSAE